MKVKSYGLSNVGMKRSQNEDSYLVNDDLALYIVADGMGGHLGGEYASRLSVSTIEEVVSRLSNPEATQIHGVNGESSAYGDRLRFAITEASKRVFEQAQYDESLKGMGTTTVAVLLDTKNAYIANVGDSRAYLIRAGEIEQITEDHSLVSEQIKAGLINPDDARGHRFKNIITRSVGYQEEVQSDLVVEELQIGDKILLCSDGLSNMLEDEDILEVVDGLELKEACEKLILLANQRGGDDNITALLFEVLSH